MTTRAHRILIVDDSAEDREIYRRLILRDIGGEYEVVEADCGEAGLHICRKTPPACVLLDYNLPDIDGLEFLGALGGRRAAMEIPIVFLTGKGNEAVAVRALKEGAHDYLVKSGVTAESLRHALRGAIEGCWLRREIEKQRVHLAEQAKALREADRRKDEFLAMLAHELRNPLAPIRAMAAVLRRAPIDHPLVKKACVVIERQVEQMTRITDDLLDVSRIARGSLQLLKEPCDLTAIVREAVEDVREQMDNRRLRLVASLPDRPLLLCGDRHRLSQALHNLLHNAQKFTPEGGAVTVRLSEKNGGAAVVVEDTGAGVAEKLLPHIFDAFRQGPQTIERSGGGLGLGLALVKGVALLHGGDVTAANLEDRGAAFALNLPLDEAGEAPKECAAIPEWRARRVLLVEDNFDVADSTRQLLEVMGHDVRVAMQGEEAIKLARDFKPEFVLCDIGLPGAIDGFAVARGLRQEAGLTGARLVSLSGYGHKEVVDKAHAAGFERHLTKPIGEEGLAQLLAERP